MNQKNNNNPFGITTASQRTTVELVFPKLKDAIEWIEENITPTGKQQAFLKGLEDKKIKPDRMDEWTTSTTNVPYSSPVSVTSNSTSVTNAAAIAPPKGLAKALDEMYNDTEEAVKKLTSDL